MERGFHTKLFRLFVIVFCCSFSPQGTFGLVTVDVTGTEYVDIEENATFLCSPSGAFDALRWKKSEDNSSTLAEAGTILTLFPGLTPIYDPSVDRMHYQFDAASTNKLTALSVTPSDAGKYWCQLEVGGQPDAVDSLFTTITAPPGNAKKVKFEVDGMSYDPEKTIKMTPGKTGVMVTFTVYGIIPNATNVLWSVNPSQDTNLNKESFLSQSNAEDPRFGDSVSTATLDIPDAPGQLMLTCNVTYSRDGTTKSPGTAFSVTINVTATTPESTTASSTIGGPGPSAPTEVSTTGTSTTKVSTSIDPTTTGSTTWMVIGGTGQLNTSSITPLLTTGSGPGASGSTPILTSTPTPILTTDEVDRGGSSDELTTGQIVGICVGAGALVVILLVLTFCIFCRESLSKRCSCLQCKSSVNPGKEGGTTDKEALELNGGSTSNKEKEEG